MAKSSILIVKDVNVVLKNIEAALEKFNYKISGIVSTGEEALDILKDGTTDLVILGVELRGKLDGIETATQIKKEFQIPFIFLSSSLTREILDIAVTTEPDGFLCKPFSLSELNASIQIALYKRKKPKEDRKNNGDSNKFIQMVTNDSSELITIVDFEGKKIYNNDSYANLLNESNTPNGTDLFSDIHPDDREMISEIFQDVILSGTGQSAKYRLVLKDGSIRHIESHLDLIKNKNSDPANIIFVGHDNSGGNNSSNKPADSGGVYSDLAANLPIGVFRSNPDKNGKLLFANSVFINLLGYSDLSELQGLSVTDLYSNIHDRGIILDKIYKSGHIRSEKVEFKKKDGTRIKLALSAKLAQNRETNEQHIDGIIENIIETSQIIQQTKKYNEKLEDLNKTKDIMFSIIAHDLRSPFTALLGFSEYITKYYKDLSKNELHEYCGLLHNSAQNIFNLLENLLNWSKMHVAGFSLEPTKFRLNSTVQKVYNIFAPVAADKGIKLISNECEDYILNTDENLIYTILRNFVSNGVKFTDKGGTVKISTQKKDDRIVASVTDTGIGISKDNLNRLFDINTHISSEGTEYEKGCGLGLLLCKELANKSEGLISVESEPGKGSKFSFSIALPDD
ncbi:ATP-binding protein [Bacteroidota bacterium]